MESNYSHHLAKAKKSIVTVARCYFYVKKYKTINNIYQIFMTEVLYLSLKNKSVRKQHVLNLRREKLSALGPNIWKNLLYHLNNLLYHLKSATNLLFFKRLRKSCDGISSKSNSGQPQTLVCFRSASG